MDIDDNKCGNYCTNNNYNYDNVFKNRNIENNENNYENYFH